jgi:hypothetical protein
MLVALLTYSSIIQTEVIYSSETSFDLHWTVQRHILEDRTLHALRCWEYLKLRGITKRGWRKLHNEELHTLADIRTIKPRRISAGHVEREVQIVIGSFGKIYERRRQIGRPTCRWEEMLKWILRTLDRRLWTGFFCVSIGTINGLL